MSGTASCPPFPTEALPADYEIPTIDGRTLTYESAYERFFAPNLPFIVTGLMDDWPACHDWVSPSSTTEQEDRAPNWESLEGEYGDARVGVVDCNDPVDERCPEEMELKEIIAKWRDGEGKGLYIKDWHLRRFACEKRKTKCPAQAQGLVQDRQIKAGEGDQEGFYNVPNIFGDDWMDTYYTDCKEDEFAFVYFGTEGTSTPLHRDVYTSYSWSANVLGTKRWHFVPPSSAGFCRRDPSSRTSALLSDPTSVDVSLFPSFPSARVLTALQPPKSIIFVPSGWYHSVENISPFVISINHNWGNAVNLRSMFTSMCEEVEDTQEAVIDVKELLERRLGKGTREMQQEWVQVVQDIVRKNAGWGWSEFLEMVAHNLALLNKGKSRTPLPPCLLANVRDVLASFSARHELAVDPGTRDAFNAAQEALDMLEHVMSGTADEKGG